MFPVWLQHLKTGVGRLQPAPDHKLLARDALVLGADARLVLVQVLDRLVPDWVQLVPDMYYVVIMKHCHFKNHFVQYYVE